MVQLYRRLSLAALLFLAFSSAAFANCTLNGASYPEGTVYGTFVCTNGQWVHRR